MKRIGNHLLHYLKDWKNLLAHTIVGVLILAVAFYIPIEPVYRVVGLYIIIAFNILRMRMSKKKEYKFGALY